MKLLVIGGTRFLGRAVVEAALGRDHEITLFHRGHTNPGLFEVEAILGDRDGETDKLSGRRWDAVIDTCGYFPRIVEQTADQLTGQVDRYCFISSISVYDDCPEVLHEGSPVVRFEGAPEREEITGESYGRFKVLCEEAVQAIVGEDRTIVVRPGLIVGPHDPTDRFTYWVDRFARRDQILLPDRAQQPIQFIDVRDLADFIVRLVERQSAGTFNATGPARSITLGDMWAECRRHGGGLPTPVVVGDEFLIENEVKPWQDLPFVVPVDEPFPIVDLTKMAEAGLTFRGLAETIIDTAAWHRSRTEGDLKAGMTRSREEALLAKWSARADAIAE